MKRKLMRRIIASAMALLLAVGLLPFEFLGGEVEVEAAETVYVLDAGTVTAATLTANTKARTGEHFTLIATDSKTIVVEANKKSINLDGTKTEVANRIKFNGDGKTTERAISFTVSEGMTAKVDVYALSSNDTTAVVKLQNSDASVEETKDITLKNAPDTGIEAVTFSGLTAGTYYLFSKKDSTNGKTGNANIYYVKVTETSAAPSTGAAPVITGITKAQLNADGTAVDLEWTIDGSNAGSGDGAIEVLVSKDGGAAESVAKLELGTTAYSYGVKASGSYVFTVRGTFDGTPTAEQVSPAVTYELPLGTANASAQAGDTAVTLKWNAVTEASSYAVNVYESADGEAVKTVPVAGDTTTATVDGLTNGKEYWFTVTTQRTAPQGQTTGEKVSAIPYKPVDASSAIPQMTVTNQNADRALVVVRENGSLTISQANADSGSGIGSKGTNGVSFIAYPTPISTDYTMTADVTLTNLPDTTTEHGIYLGAYSSLDAGTVRYVTLALRNKNGGAIELYRSKTTGYGGSSIGTTAVNNLYSLKVERSGDKYICTVSQGGKELGSKTFDATASDTTVTELQTGSAVYAGFAICGVSADITNIKLTTPDGTLVDSSTWEGSFSPFQGAWADVAAPVIASHTIDAAAGTVSVVVNENIGLFGAGSVDVTMYDAAGNALKTESVSAFNTNSNTLTFAPPVSGTYTFKAAAKRTGEAEVKESAVYTVDGFVHPIVAPMGLAAFTGKNASVNVEWNAVSEAGVYEVSSSADNFASVVTVTAQDGKTIYSCNIPGLTVGTAYTFRVTAKRSAGVTAAQDMASSEISATVADHEQRKWVASSFGTSTSKSRNKVEALDGKDISVENGFKLLSCTVKADGSIDGKGGKFVSSDPYDGITYYYTQIDPDTENFVITGTFTLDYMNPTPDGQEGFGILVRDSIGEDGNSSGAFYTNSVGALATKTEWTDDNGKHSLKDGLLFRAFSGVTSTTAAPDGSKVVLKSGPLDETELVNADKVGTSYTFTVKMDNTGYHVSYTNPAGETKSYTVYGKDKLRVIDPDSVYVGFAAARGCNVTVSDISFTTSDPATDPPAEKEPVEYVEPSYAFISSTTSGSDNYTLMFRANADGVVTVKDADGTVFVENAAVQAGKAFTASAKLAHTDTIFTAVFTPNADYVPGAGQELSTYETKEVTITVNKKHFGDANGNIFVSQNGSAGNAGTSDSPIDLDTALKYAAAGQKILLAGGTYTLNSGVSVPRGVNGTADNMIYMLPDPDAAEKVVFDFNRTGSGITFWGDYWYVRGIDVKNSADGQKGIQLSGHHCVFELVNTYDNGNTGFQVSGSSADSKDLWPSDNLILNCTSHNNADKAMEDADGFAAKLTTGEGNVFYGCIAAYNADDGWDCFAKTATGTIGAVTLINCVAYKNGYLEDGTVAGNGNGFKMGGSALSGKHVVINSIAYDNKAKGIDSNSCPDVRVYSSTSYNNQSYNVALYSNNGIATDFIAEGIISYKDKYMDVTEQLKLNQSTALNSADNYFWDGSASKNADGAQVTGDMFVSLDTSAAPARNADGTINMNGLLQLTDAAPAGSGARFDNPEYSLSAILARFNVSNEIKVVKAPTENNNDNAGSSDNAQGVEVIAEAVFVSVPSGVVFKNNGGNTINSGRIFLRSATNEEQLKTVSAQMDKAMADSGIEKTMADKVSYYDVELVDENGNKVTFENGSLTIRFAYPEGTGKNGFVFDVYHGLADGKIEKLTPSLTDGGIEVTVTSLSPFAIVSRPQQTSPATGNNRTAAVLAIAVLLTGGFAAFCFARRKKSVVER